MISKATHLAPQATVATGSKPMAVDPSRTSAPALEPPLPVLALTISRASHGAQRDVLVVVRRPETNLSHGSVVCVPTQRMPRSIMADLMREVRVTPSNGVVGIAEEIEVRSDDNRCDHPLIYAVEHLLARKLELSEVLERRELSYRARVKCVLTADSEIGVATAAATKIAPVTVVNIALTILAGADRLPSATASYSRIFWSDSARFLDAAQTRNATLLAPDLGPIEFCVRGHCVTTAAWVLQHV